jgi:hypothetical protein
MKRFLGGALEICTGIILLLLAHEIALRFLPVARAPAVQVPTATDTIQRWAANQPFTWSLGWNFYVVVHGRTNAQGFVADYDYAPAPGKPTVAVIGDSMVEALMVPFAQAMPGRLQAMLGDTAQVVAIAQSGSPMSQYVAYAAHACATYRPQTMVVVIVNNDFDESVYANRLRNGVHHLYPRADGGFDHKLTPQPPLGILERMARRSALALYITRNVGINQVIANMGITTARAETAAAGGAGTGDDQSSARIEEGKKVIAWFLEAMPGAACLPPSRIVIVVDALRPAIYDDAQLRAARPSYFGRLRAEVLAQASAKGFVVIDAEEPMRADYQTARKPFEFPTDAHWNAHAHSIVAAAVRKALPGWP